MPYGLVNAHSVFQDFMHEVLREYLHRIVLVYIDDILKYIRSMAEHRHHVAEVLKRLRELLFLKAEKCSFHQPSMQFLGYNINSDGIQMDERKVEAIKAWLPPCPTPSTIKELKCFLGFSNFYRRFIHDYSIITSPLTNLLKNKPKSLSWTPAATEEFKTLKEAFTSTPLFIHPDPGKPVLVELYASTSGVWVVFSQQQWTPDKLHPCAFFSRKLSSAEMNYNIGNRELLAIKLALEVWRVCNTHSPSSQTKRTYNICVTLKYFILDKPLSTSQISYRPGLKNVRADALSHVSIPQKSSVMNQKPTFQSKLSSAPSSGIQSQIPPPMSPHLLRPAVHPVCNSLFTPLIHSVHTSLGTGHPGANGTLSLLKDRFWWSNMTRDVRRFVQGCSDCAVSKNLRHLPSGKLLPLHVPNRPWSHLGVDFIIDLSASDGITCVLVVIDQFSKSCRLLPSRVYPHPWRWLCLCLIRSSVIKGSLKRLSLIRGLNLSPRYGRPFSLS